MSLPTRMVELVRVDARMQHDGTGEVWSDGYDSWSEYVTAVAEAEVSDRFTSEYVGSLVGADRWTHPRLCRALADVWISEARSLPDRSV